MALRIEDENGNHITTISDDWKLDPPEGLIAHWLTEGCPTIVAEQRVRSIVERPAVVKREDDPLAFGAALLDAIEDQGWQAKSVE